MRVIGIVRIDISDEAAADDVYEAVEKEVHEAMMCVLGDPDFKNAIKGGAFTINLTEEEDPT